MYGVKNMSDGRKVSWKEILTISAGTFIVAAAVYFFMLPSKVSIGSGAALAMILSNYIPLPVSVITFGLNIILLIIGFILIGPEFGAKTIFCSLLMPGYIAVLKCFSQGFSRLLMMHYWMLFVIFWLWELVFLFSSPATLLREDWILLRRL